MTKLTELGWQSPRLTAYLHQLTPHLPESEINDIASFIRVQEYPRASFFTQIGDTHDKVGFVLSGIFRVYYIGPEGQLYIRNFCKEGMPIGSYATILQKDVAHVNIESIEAARVVEFSFSEISKRFDRHPAWERLGRRLAEEHYIARERREYQFMSLDAAARYQAFQQEYAGCEARISQANIASYLGVKPETLSRLRRNKG